MKGKKKQAAGTPGPEWKQYESPAAAELLAIRAELQALKGKPNTFADVAEIMCRLSDTARKLGGYYFAVPEALLIAGKDYFCQHAEQVRAALEQGGADTDTIAAVLCDYGAALCGLSEYNATPQQMAAALKACGPKTAYNIDKYAFFVGLLYCYQRNLNALAEYTAGVKNEPDATKRELFFNTEVSAGEFTDLRAAALRWLQDIGYITAADFAGIEQDTIRRFLRYVDTFGDNGKFVQYVYIAKHALNATPEQLEQLPPPPIFAPPIILRPAPGMTGEPIRAALVYADLIGNEITEFLERVAEQVEANGSEYVPFTAGVIEVKKTPVLSGKITVSEDCALILGRPLYASTDGKTARDILPISAFIADYAAHNPAAMKVTAGVLEKTVEGVNLLQQLKRTAPANGIYTLKTNLTEFSELCGFPDANEKEKQNLLTALHVLHNLYIVVWKPTGRVAVQLFGLQQYGLANGGRERELILNVFASGFRGRPQFWDAQQYALLRKKEKGAAMRHFRHQIGSKQHAKEEDLLLQIFGYGLMRDEANRTNDAGQIAAVNEYIRKHKARDKKRLRGWFDDWARQGYLTYSVRANKSGELVYNWRRTPAAPQETENETNE